MQTNYRPELDTSAELKLEGMRYYQDLIGVLKWAIELGRIDIAMEVLMLLLTLCVTQRWTPSTGVQYICFLEELTKANNCV
jgi:hypothetical protein